MRHGAFGFAFAESRLPRLERFPDPSHPVVQVFRNGVRKIAHHLFFNVRPEFRERHRAVKSHVECFVKGVVETFHEGISAWSFWIRADRASPERSAVGENIKFVEEHAAIPSWLAF